MAVSDLTRTRTDSSVFHPDKPTRYRVVLAIILFVTLLVSYLDRTNISVLSANDTFLADMGITGDTTRIGLLLTVFLLAYGIANIVLAPLGNLMGPRTAMMLAIVLWAVAVILGGLAGGFLFMLATRIILGLGEGLHWPWQQAADARPGGLAVTRGFPVRIPQHRRWRPMACWRSHKHHGRPPWAHGSPVMEPRSRPGS